MRIYIGIPHLLLQALFLSVTLFLTQISIANPKVFRFHIVEEPSQIRASLSDRFTGKYVVGNLFYGLYRFTGDDKLVPALAEKCDWHGVRKLVCRIKASKWSGGKTFGAKEIYEHLKRILNRKNLNEVSENFLGLKNYKEYLSGKLPWEKVGIRLSGNKLIFDLSSPDRDFLFRLTHPSISPFPEVATDEQVGKDFATGPYRLKSWTHGRSLNFEARDKNQPDVEVFFIAEDTTALNMFEKDQLDLLRRMPLESVPRFKKDPRLSFLPLLRFDYIGVGSELKDSELKKLHLGTAFDFEQFQKVFQSKGIPGCVGLPAKWQSPLHCLHFDKANISENAQDLNMYYSAQGGEDMARSIQWFQGQYKKNRGGFMNLHQEDIKMLTARLKKNPPELFRRGLPVDRPSCLAALESFHSSSPDNFIGFKNKTYDQNLDKLKNPKASEVSLAKICASSISLLLDSGRLIPLGEIHFPILDSKRFTGWKINSLNQLDLHKLRPNTAETK